MKVEDIRYQPPEVVRRLRLEDDDVPKDSDVKQGNKKQHETPPWLMILAWVLALLGVLAVGGLFGQDRTPTPVDPAVIMDIGARLPAPGFPIQPTRTRTPSPRPTYTPRPTATPGPAIQPVALPCSGTASFTSGPPDSCLPKFTRPGTYQMRYSVHNANGWSDPVIVTINVGIDPQGQQFKDWIYELTNIGVTGGCGGNNYCPSNNVTRAQMSVFILKGLAYVAQHPEHFPPGWTAPPCSPPGSFTDVPCYTPTPKPTCTPTRTVTP
jgi:hypothetical protein